MYFIDELRDLNRKIQPLGFIAGGVCRSILNNETVKDIDIFCKTEDSFDELIKLFGLERPDEIIAFGNYDSYIEVTRENDLMLEFPLMLANREYIIQIIKPRRNEHLCTFGAPLEVVSKFDFSVCRLYLDELGNITSVDNYDNVLIDLNRKTLRVNNIVCPISSMRRALKYVTKGYFLPLNEMMKLFVEFQNRGLVLDEIMEKLRQEEPSEIDWYEFFIQNNID